MTGSFNPIDVGEWSHQAYIRPTERLFAAIARGDRLAVSTLIATQPDNNDKDDDKNRNKIDVNDRDHVGRTPLHLAILANAEDSACNLIDAGARISSRLVDGRTALHLAVKMDSLVVVRRLLERSAANAAAAAAAAVVVEGDQDEGSEATAEGSDRLSSEDDWSSADDDEDGSPEDGEVLGDNAAHDNDDDDYEHVQKSPSPDFQPREDVEHIPEDNPDTPDILDVNGAEWDFHLSPLHVAAMYASAPVVRLLLDAGADYKKVTYTPVHGAAAFHPLTLTLFRDDDEEDRACEIVEELLKAGASSSPADISFCTIFHRAVLYNKPKIVDTLLRLDRNADRVLNFPVVTWEAAVFPIVTAILEGWLSVLAVLLVHGAKLVFTEEDIEEIPAAYVLYPCRTAFIPR